MKAVATFVLSALGLAFSQSGLASYWLDTQCSPTNIEVPDGYPSNHGYYCWVEVRTNGSGWGINDPYPPQGTSDTVTKAGARTPTGSGATRNDPKIFEGVLGEYSCQSDTLDLETAATGLFFAGGPKYTAPNGNYYKVKLSDGYVILSWMTAIDYAGGTSRPLRIVETKCRAAGQ